MNFTDLFIRRPVLSSVVSLVILVVGLRSYSSLQVLAYPKTENGIVTVTTAYPGADPDAIAGFITTPIENAIAQANGIDYMTSTSQSSTSTITVNLRQNYDTDKAAAEINIKVNSVLNQLPPSARSSRRSPSRSARPSMPCTSASTATCLAPNQITDYLTTRGAAEAAGRRGRADGRIARRAQISRCAPGSIRKLAAYGLTASDMSTALASNDYISAVGNTKGQMVQVTLTATTSLHSLERIPQSLVVKQFNGANMRLSDVGECDAGRRQLRSAHRRFDGKNRRCSSASRWRPPRIC
jgi:multidrug efflux pump